MPKAAQRRHQDENRRCSENNVAKTKARTRKVCAHLRENNNVHRDGVETDIDWIIGRCVKSGRGQDGMMAVE